MFEWALQLEAWVALTTLIALEVVLGIDNIIFISILVGKLPEDQRNKARTMGLILAMVTRLLLLFSLVWVMGLIQPLFDVFGNEISGRDIILILGGLFLLAKSTHEIHNSLEIPQQSGVISKSTNFFSVLVQIALLDIIFSLDSVITAVGLVDHLSIMVIAVVISVGIMLLAAKSIGDFVDKNPTIKMLALSFLMLIGFTLMADGFDVHVPKGYIYFAMAFSLSVEMLNIKIRSRNNIGFESIQLTKKISDDDYA